MTDSSGIDEWGYRKIDNVTDEVLNRYQAVVGPAATKELIFHYVYAVLHSEQYRSTFAADLTRMLPRIPLPSSESHFLKLAEAGQQLAALHLEYESVEPYPLDEQTTGSLLPEDGGKERVTKMRWRSKTDHSAVVYNNHLTLAGIPDEAHQYRLGSRTALEWLIDRYQVTTDKKSAIVNDPNDWALEHEDPRYIVDLIKRVTTVSLETVRIVNGLPELDLG